MSSTNPETCRICGSPRIRSWERVRGYRAAADRMFDYFECIDCESVFLSRRTPAPSEIYSGPYFTRPTQGLVSRLERCWTRLTQGWRRNRSPAWTPGAKVLDVGCGTAGWLEFLGKQGYQPYGLEPSRAACDIARTRKGIEITCGTLENHSFHPGSFDVVTALHCLEHAPDPRTFIQLAVGLLKQGGWLGISIPNISSWEARRARAGWFHLDPPYHECLPSLRALEDIIRKVGCENIEVRCPISECPQSLLYAWLGVNRISKLWVVLALPAVLFIGAFFALQRQGGVVEVWARKR